MRGRTAVRPHFGVTTCCPVMVILVMLGSSNRGLPTRPLGGAAPPGNDHSPSHQVG
jgi:hypothetical protein